MYLFIRVRDGKNCEVKCKSKDIVCKDRQCGQICGYDCGTCVLGTCDSKGKCAQCEKDGDCHVNEQCDLQTNKCICKDILDGIIVLFPNVVEPYNVLGMGEHVRKLLTVLTNVLTRLLRINLLIVLDRKVWKLMHLEKLEKRIRWSCYRSYTNRCKTTLPMSRGCNYQRCTIW